MKDRMLLYAGLALVAFLLLRPRKAEAATTQIPAQDLVSDPAWYKDGFSFSTMPSDATAVNP